MGRRAVIAVTAVALDCALAGPLWGFGSGSDGATGPDRPPRAVAAGSGQACRLLDRRLARAYLGALLPVHENRMSGGKETCTYISRSGNRSVSVGVYPAANYEAAAAALTDATRSWVLGRRAAFNERVGYLVAARPGDPYYVQVAFQHVSHLHADQPMSERLVASVLGGAGAPAGPFVCSITKRREI
jgi:hypothetical protein